jgi:hypothetical protein
VKRCMVFVAAFVVGLVANGQTPAAELADLKILYIGSERASDYIHFLKGKVAAIEAKSRADFQPKDADGFDVVLLDWPQGEETREMRKRKSPLGARDDWKTPTVLLGSAGLNLAVCWKLQGGSGCTCLDPLAYDLRQHEIFERPFRIDRSQMISIPTPADFRAEIQEKEIKVLPLVADIERSWPAGWCTHTRNIERYPDVELFCGGVNHQTPTSASVWRQGNLLHFGFELSPADMTKAGQALLLSAIVYISRFSEDRPIAMTPSVFAGPVAYPRQSLARYLRNLNYDVDLFRRLVVPEVWRELSKQPNRKAMAKWAEEHERFFHPDKTQRLAVDEDLMALGVPFDDPRFFDKAFGDLRAKDHAAATRALRLLQRYVPMGPTSAPADAWEKWWKENRAYAFASDDGDYRWYIDPLAKKRGVPASELRGPKRADQR